ncbi:MAG: carboxyl transferase domain-containing protein, partial [Microthrixaceae bacterium]
PRRSTRSFRPRRANAYDMVKVVKAIVDDGDFFEFKATWARNIVCGIARLDGESVGIITSQPKVLGGALDVNAADKSARFVWLCDAFVPLVFLHDVPGFVVGTVIKKQGIIRHGAKMLFAISEATVPKISVILRKSYGAGYFVMNGRAYEADYLVAWPTAGIAVMGPDGVVNIAFRKQLEEAPEGPARQAAHRARRDDPRQHRSVGRRRPHTRRRCHRSRRHPRHDHRGPQRQPEQAGVPPLAQARRHARLTLYCRRLRADPPIAVEQKESHSHGRNRRDHRQRVAGAHRGRRRRRRGRRARHPRVDEDGDPRRGADQRHGHQIPVKPDDQVTEGDLVLTIEP